MAPKFHPRKLFGPRTWPKKLAPYASDLDMLDDVRDRKKAMMRTSVRFSSFEAGDAWLAELVDAALERGLVIIIDDYMGKHPTHSWIPSVYVTHIDQAWRVPALKALKQTAFIDDGRWTLSAEAQESLLLGYTAQQRRRWIASERQRQAIATGLDLFTLLTPPQVRTARSLGMRCFGTPSDMEGMTFFFPRNNTVPKDDALALVPKGLTFARVGVRWPAAHKLFGQPSTWKGTWMSVDVTAKQAQILSEGLATNVQRLTARGWR
jgi:hypothetical protein